MQKKNKQKKNNKKTKTKFHGQIYGTRQKDDFWEHFGLFYLNFGQTKLFNWTQYTVQPSIKHILRKTQVVLGGSILANFTNIYKKNSLSFSPLITLKHFVKFWKKNKQLTRKICRWLQNE